MFIKGPVLQMKIKRKIDGKIKDRENKSIKCKTTPKWKDTTDHPNVSEWPLPVSCCLPGMRLHK